MLKKNSLRIEGYRGYGGIVKFIGLRDLYKFSNINGNKQDSLLFTGGIAYGNKIYNKKYWY